MPREGSPSVACRLCGASVGIPDGEPIEDFECWRCGTPCVEVVHAAR